MKTSRSLVLLLCLAFASPSALGAEGLEWSFIGPRFNFLVLDGIPLPTGADIELRQPLSDGADWPLSLSLRIGGGYEDGRLLRDAASGDPIQAPTEASDPQRFHAPNAQWDLGLVLGLAGAGGTGQAEAFLLYRGGYALYDNELPTTVFADAGGSLGTALILGAAYEGLDLNGRRLLSGAALEASLEWAPGFLASSFGPVDYFRVNLQAELYRPLFSLGRGELNLLSSYLALFGSLDYAGGSSIPIAVMQSFGGRELRPSLGGSVRGYPKASYDASLKAVGNLELRLLGPALFDIPWFLPLLYGFGDLGYYAGLSGAGPSWAEASGSIASVGGGFALCLFDYAYIGVQAGLLLPGGDELFPVYLPEEGRGFLSFEFLLHF